MVLNSLQLNQDQLAVDAFLLENVMLFFSLQFCFRLKLIQMLSKFVD